MVTTRHWIVDLRLIETYDFSVQLLLLVRFVFCLKSLCICVCCFVDLLII